MDTNQCARCVYWRRENGDGSTPFCHHLLDTGKCRKRNGDLCLSRDERKRKKKKNPFEVPPGQQ